MTIIFIQYALMILAENVNSDKKIEKINPFQI